MLAADTLTTIAAGLSAAINASAPLQAIGLSASVSGTVITLQSNSPNLTTYRQTTTATESILFTTAKYGWQVANIGGTKTTGNVLTITVLDALLAGGQEPVNYTVLAGDTLTSITTGLAAAINTDVNLQAIGVTATASSTALSLESLSPNLTTYSQSKSSGATETIALGATYGLTQSTYNSVNELVGVGGGGAARFQGSTDKPVTSSAASTQVLNIKASQPSTTTSYSTSVTRTAPETLSFSFIPGYNLAGDGYPITVGGTPAVGDVLSVTVLDFRLPLGSETVSYTVVSGDTTTSIATGLLNAIGYDAALNTLLWLASTSSQTGGRFVLTNSYPHTPPIPNAGLTSSITSVGSETLTIDDNGAATIGGTVTTGDVLSIVVQNQKLPGGQELVSYTVQAGDTLTSIATGIKNTVNADVNLQSISLSAIASGAVVTLLAYTSYAASTSGGATETLTLSPPNRGNITATVAGVPRTGDILTITAFNGALPGRQKAISYTVLATDTLVSIATGLATAFNADTNLQTLGVKVDSNATLAWSQSFSANALLPPGAGTTSVSATDGSNNTKINGYALSVNGGSSSTLSYDANGNMTSDGTNSFAAE